MNPAEEKEMAEQGMAWELAQWPAYDEARDGYQLLDFGDGRRLERFGEVVLDRPCPAAEGMTGRPGVLGPQPMCGSTDGPQRRRANGPCGGNWPRDGPSLSAGYDSS